MSNQIPYKLYCVKGKERWNKRISFTAPGAEAAGLPQRSGPVFPALLHRTRCKWQAEEGNAPAGPGNNGESQGLRRNTHFLPVNRRNPLPVKDERHILHFLARLWYAACCLLSSLRGGRRLHEPDPASYHLAAPFFYACGRFFMRSARALYFQVDFPEPRVLIAVVREGPA
jgi:hypothetical protein